MYPVEIANTSDAPIAVQKMAAELELAEAELKTARLKYQYLKAKEEAEQESTYDGNGTPEMPHRFD
jgi:hypothetical protein